ncbi:MAG: NAD(P)-dependent glycerol-3-phosphate dehydrogenase [Acholeplasmataceae bacterium]|nr:NAD(P)-dependent glycerol-3-phosphate dehydrogenase [Acholeplasmataceae bacterium]
MNVSFIGGGAWGTTLAQVISDNGHLPLVYDVRAESVDMINRHLHPFFDTVLPDQVKATSDLKTCLAFSDVIVLGVPSKAIRGVFQTIASLLETPKLFVNVAKGIEPGTSKRSSEIAYDEIPSHLLKGFVQLTGPSHAEEVILRKLTLLVAASDSLEDATMIQHLFANDSYLRVYTSTDLIGSEVAGAIKNAIAVISGACTGLGLGENARAAVITRGIVEIVRVVVQMGGRRETAFGLAGIGDLVVTASSEHSRNFRAGRKIGLGIPIDQVYAQEKQTIEGFRAIEAVHDFSIKTGIELPMINIAFKILKGEISAEDAVRKLLGRDLKSEDF